MTSRPYKVQTQTLTSRPYKQKYAYQIFTPAITPSISLFETVTPVDAIKIGFRSGSGIPKVPPGTNWANQLGYNIGAYFRGVFERFVGQGTSEATRRNSERQTEAIFEGLGPGTAYYINGIRKQDYPVAQLDSRCVTRCKQDHPGTYPELGVFNNCYCKKPSQSGCANACQKIRKPGYSMAPRQLGDKCYCNFKLAGTQSGCSTACSKIRKPGYSQSPQQVGDKCYCNFKLAGTQSGCTSACSRLKKNNQTMSPQQVGDKCYCHFKTCGTQNGCNEACYKLGNSRYGSGKYRMNPKQSSCTNCSCNFTKCGTQNGCNEACYKLGNSRYGSGKYRMNPKQNGCTSCSCNFVKCGTQSGCVKACPSKSGYTKSPRQANCTTCYCNYKRSFRCSYSGCGGTTSASQCYQCRCRGICNNSRCGGVRRVSSTGGCWCNKAC